MKTENDFLLELVDMIYHNGMSECACSFIFNETGIVSGGSNKPLIQMNDGAIQLCQDIYSTVIGEVAMGYTITAKDNEAIIDDITNHILLCNKG